MRRGRTRLQVLLLLLKLLKGKYISIIELRRQHHEVFGQALEDWYMYLLHRDGLIEFEQMKVADWRESGQGVYIPINSRIFKSDKVRINPSNYDLISVEEELIKQQIESKGI